MSVSARRPSLLSLFSRRKSPRLHKPACITSLPLDQLPADVNSHALNFLNIAELASLLGVNRLWQQEAKDALRSRRTAGHRTPSPPEHSTFVCATSNAYVSFLAKYCPQLRYLDLSAELVCLKPLLELLGNTKSLEFLSVGDVYTSPADILPRDARYDERYDNIRIAHLRDNINAVIDLLATNCTSLRMLSAATAVDDSTVAKIASAFPKSKQLEAVQLGGLALTTNFESAAVAHLVASCPQLRVLNVLCQEATDIGAALDDAVEIPYLALPYCDVDDHDIDHLHGLRELNLGCDIITVHGLRTLARQNPDLTSLCFTTRSSADFRAALKFLARDGERAFAKLELLGVRSPIDFEDEPMEALKQARPDVHVFEYRDKPRVEDEWCFAEFNFESVCRRAGLLQ